MSDPTAISPALLAQVLAASAAQTNIPSQPNAQVIELPPELQTLPAPQTLIAQVIRQSSEGVLAVRAEVGDLTLQTSLPFTPGDSVNVRIENGAPPENATLRLLAETPEQNYTQGSEINTPLPTPLTTLQLLNTLELNVTPLTPADIPNIVQPFVQIIENTMTSQTAVQPTPFIPPAPQPLLALPHSTNENISKTVMKAIHTSVPLRTIAAQLPLAEPIKTDTTPPPRAPLQISVTHIDLLQNPQAALLSDARAGQIQATFIALTPQQHFPVFQTISETPQTFALQTSVENLQLGTQITLDITQTVLPLNVSLPPLANEPWASLSEVRETLVQHAQQAAQVFQAAIPNIGAPTQIATAVLFFLVAVRSGDVPGWLSDSVTGALKRAGKGDLINRIANEFTTVSRQDSAAGEWRALSLPLAWNNEIHKIAVSYRKDDEHNSKGQKTGTQTRFVMDLNLSAMGKVQLDALFSSASKRLDLIVRTQQDFTAAARQHMRETYKNALNETGITGELSFIGSPQGWVHVDEATEPEFTEDV